MWFKIFLSLLIISVYTFADPWGKDADLCQKRIGCERTAPNCDTPIIGCLAEKAIAFHQKVISPCDGPRSHFLPSSSQYTMEAMRKYGFFQGYLMGCDRLMRENDDPWVYRMGKNCAGDPMKLDPVR